MSDKQCPKCYVELIPSKALQNAWVGGLESGSCRQSLNMNDFEIGDTITRNGDTHLIDCLKCPACGYSITAENKDPLCRFGLNPDDPDHSPEDIARWTGEDMFSPEKIDKDEDFYNHSTEVEADREFVPIDFEGILNEIEKEVSALFKGCPFCEHPVQILEVPDAYGNRYVCPLGHCGMPTSNDWETRRKTNDFERGYAEGLDSAANTIIADGHTDKYKLAPILRDEAKRVRKEHNIGES